MPEIIAVFSNLISIPNRLSFISAGTRDYVLRKYEMSSKYRYGLEFKLKNNYLHLFLLIVLFGEVALNPGPGSTEPVLNPIYYLKARSCKAFVPFHDDPSKVCKITLLQELVHSGSLKIIYICETWLNDSVFSSELLPGYIVFQADLKESVANYCR